MDTQTPLSRHNRDWSRLTQQLLALAHIALVWGLAAFVVESGIPATVLLFLAIPIFFTPFYAARLLSYTITANISICVAVSSLERPAWPLLDEILAVGMFISIVGFCEILRHNVLEQRATSAMLAARTARFRTILDHGRDIVGILDIRGIVLFLSSSYDRVLGYPASKARRAQITNVHQDDRNEFARVWRQSLAEPGVAIPIQFRIGHADSSWRHLEGHLTNYLDHQDIGGLLMMVRDATERRAIEAELERHRDNLAGLVEERTRELEQSRAALARSERLASIGTLAAGVAHQINNPIGAVLLAADTALMPEHDNEEISDRWRRPLEEIAGHARRCGRIVRSILSFSRSGLGEKSVGDLREVASVACDLTRTFAEGNAAKLSLDLEATPLPVRMNPLEIEQVLINLIHNAIEAGEEGDSVRITARRVADVARVEVQDAGRGISPSDLEHVFDPFYTTRLHSGGTGLGLSVAHGIAKDHGGELEIESTLGVGTIARLDLPMDRETSGDDGPEGIGNLNT